MQSPDLLDGFGVEVEIDQDKFLSIKETLTRIGISNNKKKVLVQSCHILHKRGRYWILSFKELFQLDNKPYELTDEDIQRRNLIVHLLSAWGLLNVIDEEKIEDQLSINCVKILPFREKEDWTLVSKYTVGKK